MINYFNTLLISVIGIVLLFLAAIAVEYFKKNKITVLKISYAGLFLSITFLLHLVSSYIPVTRLIQFNFGIIAVFLCGLMLGPLMGLIIVMADDSLNFLVHNSSVYHPGFAFGLCIMVFAASLIAPLVIKKIHKIWKILIITSVFIITFSIISFVINPVLLVALKWVPRLSWAIYIPRLVKFGPEILFYSFFICSIFLSVGTITYNKINRDTFRH